MKALVKSFGYAFRGIVSAFAERNFRIDIVAAAAVSVFACLYGVSKTEWVVLFIIFAAVMSAEIFNTSLERLCDKVTKEKCDEIKKAKDLAAGAVLIKALFAVLSAVFIFSAPEKLGNAFEKILTPTGLIITAIFVAAAIIFIFLPEKRKGSK